MSNIAKNIEKPRHQIVCRDFFNFQNCLSLRNYTIFFILNGNLNPASEDYTVSRNMHDEIPEMPDEVWDTDCYIYKLGPAIVPGKVIKTGKIFRNGRVWAMLDTLLTCDTISDARDLTQERLG